MQDGVLKLTLAGIAAAAGIPLVLGLPWVLRRLGLEKTNFQGQPIGNGAGLLFLAFAAPWLSAAPERVDWLAAAAAVGYGILGLVDDRWGTAEFKGLKGHLRALRSGRVTTGFLKAAGGVALALGLAWRLHPGWEALAAAPLIALGANLFNLLDLRPLRALKGFWIMGGALAVGGPPLVPALLGLSVPYAVLEARRRLMLGDTGSNLLGGVVGTAAAATLPVWSQGILVVLLLGFHLWAEKNSLSRWIEARPWARAVDDWGWNRRGE